MERVEASSPAPAVSPPATSLTLHREQPKRVGCLPNASAWGRGARRWSAWGATAPASPSSAAASTSQRRRAAADPPAALPPGRAYAVARAQAQKSPHPAVQPASVATDASLVMATARPPPVPQHQPRRARQHTTTPRVSRVASRLRLDPGEAAASRGRGRVRPHRPRRRRAATQGAPRRHQPPRSPNYSTAHPTLKRGRGTASRGLSRPARVGAG